MAEIGNQQLIADTAMDHFVIDYLSRFKSLPDGRVLELQYILRDAIGKYLVMTGSHAERSGVAVDSIDDVSGIGETE